MCLLVHITGPPIFSFFFGGGGERMCSLEIKFFSETLKNLRRNSSKRNGFQRKI